MDTSERKPIPVYTSRGDAEAFLLYPYLFNLLGDWIGFVSPKRGVYSVLGHYVGLFTEDFRIVGKRVTSTLIPSLAPPPPPKKVYPPATFPLPPMMSDLPPGRIDILLDEPERLHTTDSGEFRQDLD